MGRSTFLGFLSGGVVTAADNKGIWSEGGGALSLVAREGSTAPGLGDPTILFSDFSDVKTNDNGEVYFIAELAGGSPPVAAGSDEAIYGWSQGGGLQLVAAEGEDAPGTSASFYNLNGYSAHEGGGIAFNGDLRPGVGGVVSRLNDHGVWTQSALGAEPVLLVRSGDPFDDADGDGDEEVIRRVFVSTSEDGGTSGRSGAVACGNVAVVLSYDQNRQTTVWVLGIPD